MSGVAEQTRVEDLPLATGGNEPPEPQQEAPSEPRRRLSPRDEMMQQIALRRAQAIEDELQRGERMADAAREGAGLEPIPHPQREAPAGAPIVERESSSPDTPAQPIDSPPARAETRPAAQPASAPATSQQQLIPFRIDGNEFYVTPEQYQQLAEFGARSYSAVARTQQQPVPQQQPVQRQVQPQRAPEPPPKITAQDADAFAEQMLYGDRSKFAQALADYGNQVAERTRAAMQPSQPQVDPMTMARAIYTQVSNDFAVRNDVMTALSRIEQEFPEIATNRALGEFAAVQLGHVRQEDQLLGRTRSNLDQYRDACNRVRGALGHQPGGSQTSPASQAAPPAPVIQERRDIIVRKREAPSQPSGVDRRASVGPTERALTPSDIVRQIAKARGQSLP